jgi:hypothetical protein
MINQAIEQLKKAVQSELGDNSSVDVAIQVKASNVEAQSAECRVQSDKNLLARMKEMQEYVKQKYGYDMKVEAIVYHCKPEELVDLFNDEFGGEQIRRDYDEYKYTSLEGRQDEKRLYITAKDKRIEFDPDDTISDAIKKIQECGVRAYGFFNEIELTHNDTVETGYEKMTAFLKQIVINVKYNEA